MTLYLPSKLNRIAFCDCYPYLSVVDVNHSKALFILVYHLHYKVPTFVSKNFKPRALPLPDPANMIALYIHLYGFGS